jgi:hypothetical protein
LIKATENTEHNKLQEIEAKVDEFYDGIKILQFYYAFEAKKVKIGTISKLSDLLRITQGKWRMHISQFKVLFS